MVFSLIGGAGRMAQAAKPLMNKPAAQPRRRGLIGNVGNMLQQNRQAAPTGDRLMMALSALGGDMTPWMYNQQMQREDRRLAEERQREMQAREGERNTAQKAQLAERERLYQQADALGVPRDQFAFLPDSVREEMLTRQYAPEEPDRPSSFEEFELASQNPQYQEFLQGRDRSRATQVNVNGQRGQVTGDYVMVDDPESPAGVRFIPIPGSEAAAEAQAGQDAEATRRDRNERYAGVALDEIGRAQQILRDNPRSGGAMGQVMQLAGGTLSNELEGLYDTIGGYIARDTLQGMRDSSPTGGALGQVTERELAMLRAAYGALRVSDRAETQIYNLQRLNGLINEIVHGADAAQPTADAGEQGGGDLTPEEQRELEELRAWARSRGQ